MEKFLCQEDQPSDSKFGCITSTFFVENKIYFNLNLRSIATCERILLIFIVGCLWPVVCTWNILPHQISSLHEIYRNVLTDGKSCLSENESSSIPKSIYFSLFSINCFSFQTQFFILTVLLFFTFLLIFLSVRTNQMFDVAAHFMDFMDTTSVTLLKSDWKCQLYELVFKPTEKHLRKYLFYFRTDRIYQLEQATYYLRFVASLMLFLIFYAQISGCYLIESDEIKSCGIEEFVTLF